MEGVTLHQQQKLLLGFGLSAEIQKRKRPDPGRQAKIPTAGGKHIGGKADAEHRPCRFFQWFTLVHCKSSLSSNLFAEDDVQQVLLFE